MLFEALAAQTAYIENRNGREHGTGRDVCLAGEVNKIEAML